MRYLIFGDVHGNLPALEKMLQKASAEADQLICHGDVVNYGPWSNECVQLLKDKNCLCLEGNHEAYFKEGTYPGEHPVARAFFEFCYPRFSEHKPIAAYGESAQAGDFLVRHTLNEQYIFPDSDVEALNLENNYIIGHSHHQFSTRTASGKQLINTGSVGQNRKYINVINYVIYDSALGKLRLEALPYEVDQVIDQMKSAGYPPICLHYYQQKKRL